jgi:hypothetical protein
VRDKLRLTSFCIVVWASVAAAQTVTTSGGNTNTVPKFSGSTTLVNSAITEVNGNVGIGTTGPISALTLAGSGNPNPNTGSQIDYPGENLTFVNKTPTGNFKLGGIRIVQPTGYYLDRGNMVFTVGTGGFGTLDAVTIQSPTGNMGIGTTSPGSALEVNGSLTLSGGSNGTIKFADGSIQSTAYSPQAANVDSALSFSNGMLQVAGNIQIGNSSPNCNSPTGLFYYGQISNILLDCNQNIYFLSGMTINSNAQLVAQTSSPVGLYTQNDGFHFMADTGIAVGSAYTPSERLTIKSTTGNVGIGTTSPGATLDVAGNLKLSGAGASLTFSDGTVQSTAWSGTLCGGDYAEAVHITGERNQYEPGDVLVVDPDHPGHFLKAGEKYSTLVAGIYSTKPGIIGRRQTSDPRLASTEIPMAMVGVVPTKVTAENGPIHPGDILVTSSTSGRAMKGTDRNLFAGAIVGKALGSLSSGAGVIEVLVSLQ